MWGDRDVPFGIETCEAIAGRIPGARTFVLAGLAHLPSVEDPAAVAAAIQESTAGR